MLRDQEITIVGDTKLHKSAYGERRKEATDSHNLAYMTLKKE